MPDASVAVSGTAGTRSGLLQRLFGTFRAAYLPILVTYFAWGASGITAVAALYFQKDTLRLTPADAAAIGFWLGLPWSMKMIVGVASDAFPILGSRRKAYLVLGTVCSLAGYALVAWSVSTRDGYLAAMLLVVIGFMIQDVVADALSVEVARSDDEVAQVQTLGRVALLVGTISVGYASGVAAAALGPRPVFVIAAALPVIVAIAALFIRASPRAAPSAAPAAPPADGPLGSGRTRLVLGVGLAYAAFSVGLELLDIPFTQEIVLAVSAVLIVVLLRQIGLSRAVAISAFVIFLFRAVPGVGQGYSYWAIDHLGFDQQFLGLLAQVSSVLSLAGLLLFRKTITRRPVSFTILWVTIAGFLLSLPTIGLFYGVNEWLGLSPRAFAFIDTTISAPLGQLAMVPMLVLIAKSAPEGAEATMFAVMASLMNLALSASELGTRYLNTAFAVTQQDYAGLGHLMVTASVIGLVPLLALPLLKREEARAATAAATAPPAPAAPVAGRAQ
jgi:BT1 family protein